METTFELSQKLKGYCTVKSLMENLRINRARAIYLIHKLRKQGYVKTYKNSNQTRFYFISPQNALNETSYLDILNENTPIKMGALYKSMIYGEEPTLEETLIFCLKNNEIRYIISGIALFKKVDWSKLYKLAKKENLVVEIAALYEVARKIFPKLRKMPKRYLNLAKKKIPRNYRYIVEHSSSDDFKEIEDKWKIYIPLNLADLEEYLW